MSWLSQGLKKIGKSKITRTLGKIIDTGADFLPPGFREVGNVGGKLMQGQNLKKAAIGSVLDYAGGKLGGMVASKLGGKAGGLVAKSVPSKAPIGSMSVINGMPVMLPPSSSGGFAGGLKKIGGSVVDSLSHNKQGIIDSVLGGVKHLGVDNVLGGGALAYGAYQQKKAGDMRNKALKMVEQDYAERAPLRKLGVSGMMNEQRPDLSSVFAPAMNPFLRKVG